MVWGKGEGYKSVFLEYEEGSEDNGVDEGVDGEGGEVCIGREMRKGVVCKGYNMEMMKCMGG